MVAESTFSLEISTETIIRRLVCIPVPAGMMTATKGHFPPGNARTERDTDQELVTSDRAKVLVIYAPPYEENPARRSV